MNGADVVKTPVDAARDDLLRQLVVRDGRQSRERRPRAKSPSFTAAHAVWLDDAVRRDQPLRRGSTPRQAASVASECVRRCNETRCIVATLSTQQAAEATGKSRSTIWRDIKKGRLSAQRSDGGDFLVDVSELERVYGTIKPPETSRDDAARPPATSNEASSLQTQVALLRERVTSLEVDKHDLREERDRLLHLLEQQSEHVRLLTDQRERKRRWWQRWRREA